MKMNGFRAAIMALAGLALWGTSAARAASSTWLSGADGVWTTSGNWNNGVPSTGNSAYFTNTAWASPFTVSFANNAGANLVLGAANLVDVDFDLNGNTFTQGANLTLDNTLDWTILDGTFAQTAGYLYIGNGSSTPLNHAKVTVGAGGVLNYNVAASSFRVGSGSAGELTLRAGGKLNTTASDLRLGYGAAVYEAKVLLTGAGSVWTNSKGVVYLGYSGSAIATMNVESNAMFVHATTAAGNWLIGNAADAYGALTITSGGIVDLSTGLGRVDLGAVGTGVLTITGAGSEFRMSTNNLYLGNTAGTSHGTLIVEDGGKFLKLNENHSMNVGRNGEGELIVRNGGYFEVSGGGGALYVGVAAGSLGRLVVTGAAARVVCGDGNWGKDASTGLVTIAAGGTVEFYRQLGIGQQSAATPVSGRAEVTVTGANSTLRRTSLTAAELPGASYTTLSSLGVGGMGTSWTATNASLASNTYRGGKGTLNVEDGGLVEINNYLLVYSNSTLRVNGGLVQALNVGIETNAVFNAVLRASDANAADALVTATSEARLWRPTLKLELGSDFVAQTGDRYRLFNFTTLYSGANRLLDTNGNLLDEGAVIEMPHQRFTISYGVVDSGYITLTVLQPRGTVIVLR